VDSDGLLVDAAAAGDRDAFDELVRRYRTQILSLARALLAGSPDAEDVAQEVFVRAWRGIRTFRGETTFRGWLHRVAVNLIYSQRRKMLRERQVFMAPQPDEEAGDIERFPCSVDVENDVTLRLTIDRALAQIPLDLRTAVVLRDVQGLDYKEIADMLRIPIGTVESRIFRGRQRLRPLLRALRERRPNTEAPRTWALKDDLC
jgi:RNA polymerase sigma-70 factor (ECF subfamily)